MTIFNTDPAFKIDGYATNGLTGTPNSLAYRVHEIERHLHHYSRWFAAAAVPAGETHIADSILTASTAFQIDAGNDGWGSWLQLLGSSDTPVISGSAYYDLHTIHFTDAERTALYFVQFAFGATAAGALEAGTYTEIPFKPQSTAGKPDYMPIYSKRVAVGTKAWIRCKCPGQNTATLNLIFGLHEYEG